MSIPKKVHYDKQQIDSAFRKLVEGISKDTEIHFVYAGGYYYLYEDQLRSFILDGMKKYGIKTVMVTNINMWRENIITKERMEEILSNQHKLSTSGSVNEDLELMMDEIQLGQNPETDVETFFLPKLTEEELELVARNDASYLETFLRPEADEPKMYRKSKIIPSESDSKFALGRCFRKTYTLKVNREREIEQTSTSYCSLQ